MAQSSKLLREYNLARITCALMEGESVTTPLFFGDIMRETIYQNKLVKKLHDMFPGCFILRTDPLAIQGIPDILILIEDRWAMLEVKQHARFVRQPNQDYYVDLFGKMSFAAFIYPENEEEVLDALQSTLGVRR